MSRYLHGRCNALRFDGQLCTEQTEGGPCLVHTVDRARPDGERRHRCAGASPSGKPCQIQVRMRGDICRHHDKAPELSGIMSQLRSMRVAVDSMMLAVLAMKRGEP